MNPNYSRSYTIFVLPLFFLAYLLVFSNIYLMLKVGWPIHCVLDMHHVFPPCSPPPQSRRFLFPSFSPDLPIAHDPLLSHLSWKILLEFPYPQWPLKPLMSVIWCSSGTAWCDSFPCLGLLRYCMNQIMIHIVYPPHSAGKWFTAVVTWSPMYPRLDHGAWCTTWCKDR